MYLYLSHSNRNLVWNINCTRLPVSELITSRNLSLFWNCALSTSHCSAIPAPTVNWYFSMQAEWKLTWMSNMRQCKETFHPNVRANNAFSHTLYLLATCPQCIWLFFFAKQKGTSKWNMEACKQRGGNDITLKRDPMAIQSLVQDKRKSPTKVRTSRDSCGHSKTTTLWRLWSSLLWDHHQHHRVEDNDEDEEEKKSSTIMSNGMKPNCLIAFERLSLVSLSDIQHTHPRQLNWRWAQNFPNYCDWGMCNSSGASHIVQTHNVQTQKRNIKAKHE